MILWQLLFNLRRRSMFFFLRQNDTYMYVPLSKELFSSPEPSGSQGELIGWP